MTRYFRLIQEPLARKRHQAIVVLKAPAAHAVTQVPRQFRFLFAKIELRQRPVYSLDFRTDPAQLLHNPLIPAVNVIYALDNRLPVCH